MNILPGNETRIHFADQQTSLSTDGFPDVVIPVGAREIAESLFRHDLPSPQELEQAIDKVEDALATVGLQQGARSSLTTRDPEVIALLELRNERMPLTREQVEVLFQRLASASLGYPGLHGLPTSRVAAATLLVLRECMHHLGYESVQSVRE